MQSIEPPEEPSQETQTVYDKDKRNMTVQVKIQEYERKQARAAKQKIIQNVISSRDSGKRKHARRQSIERDEDDVKG